MDEKTRESIALFRYGLISPLLNGQRESKEYLEEESNKIHSIPSWGERQIAARTIQEWLYNYRKEGFEGIKPKNRGDRGRSRRLSTELQDHILALRQQNPEMPVTVFFEQLIKAGEIMSNEVSYATINR